VSPLTQEVKHVILYWIGRRMACPPPLGDGVVTNVVVGHDCVHVVVALDNGLTAWILPGAMRVMVP
jgi:hypothetical protein